MSASYKDHVPTEQGHVTTPLVVEDRRVTPPTVAPREVEVTQDKQGLQVFDGFFSLPCSVLLLDVLIGTLESPSTPL